MTIRPSCKFTLDSTLHLIAETFEIGGQLTTNRHLERRGHVMKTIPKKSWFTLSILIFTSSILNTVNAESKPAKNNVTDTTQMVQALQLRLSKEPSSKMKNWRSIEKAVIWGNNQTAERFRAAFPKIEFVFGNDLISVKRALEDADAFIGYCIPQLLNDELNLAWLHSMGVGVENCINSQPIQKLAPIVTNAQRLSGPEIAEHAIGLMFSLVRRLDEYGIAQQKKEWARGLAPGNDKVLTISASLSLSDSQVPAGPS